MATVIDVKQREHWRMAVLAIVLGPIAEPAMRQSLLLSQGDPTIFITRPISGPIIALALILMFLPLIKLFRNRSRRAGSAA